MTDLAILICHIPERIEFLRRLSAVLDPQITPNVKVLVDDSRYKKIGRKRNDLLDRVNAKYLCFIDDDDLISTNYVQLLLAGIHQDVDCCSLKGIITEDGQNPLLFEHSIKYKAYKTITDSEPGEIRYERYPNHLNCIKSEIAKQFRFPEEKHEDGDGNHGEDFSWAKKIHLSGLIKTEHYIPQVIYHYEYRSRK
jgi:hypothetical protein